MEILHTRENAVNFFRSYIEKNNQFLKGKKVYDLSTGTGYIGNLFHEAGSDVKLYDLFPEQIQYSSLKGEKIDLQESFPIHDSQADIVILSETIECLPDQVHFFKETSRILKTGGALIFTTANPSSLRSRFSQFMMESEHYSRPMPDETNAFVTWPGTKNGYYNKIFISGILRLRTLAAIQGLRIKEIYKSPYSSTALIFMVFYPFIYFFSWKNLRRQLKEAPENKQVYQSIFKINTSLKVLLSKHLIIEFIKRDTSE